ncbi:MAG: 5-formyltetrahydrofolate cyclo-ligase [Lachnospiraceae bacterium]|nr:5-formyltetrahydrofolate cyclo-ligase [Lachnospiraceae bacterium]
MSILEKNSERKKAIRNELIKRRNAILPKKRNAESVLILNKLTAHPWFLQAEKILTYISYGSEVDTLLFCRYCLERGKEVYCPQVLERGRMEFYRITSLAELKEGYKGIQEPPQSRPLDYREETEAMLMILPLVGFDKEGNRLGYGGGFYDRYLADKRKLNTIALAFKEQCWETGLPTESFDIKPGVILTSEGVLNP